MILQAVKWNLKEQDNIKKMGKNSKRPPEKRETIWEENARLKHEAKQVLIQAKIQEQQQNKKQKS